MTNTLIWLAQHWGIAFYAGLVLLSVSVLIASVIVVWYELWQERRARDVQDVRQVLDRIMSTSTPRAAGLKADHRRVS